MNTDELHFHDEPFFTTGKTILITFLSVVVVLFGNNII